MFEMFVKYWLEFKVILVRVVILHSCHKIKTKLFSLHNEYASEPRISLSTSPLSSAKSNINI